MSALLLNSYDNNTDSLCHFRGDRFISQRTCSEELYTNFDAKSEIFSSNSQNNLHDKLGNHPQNSTISDDNSENQGSQANSC